MPNNYVLLETITVGAAGAASVTFNNIPQSGYTDLKLVLSSRFSGGALDAIGVTFNGSSANLSSRRLTGTGTTAVSATYASNVFIGNSPGPSETANTFSNSEMYIPNYTSSNYKSTSVDAVTENNATAAYTNLEAGLWSNTAAISSITLTPYSGTNFAQYTTATIYGIAAVGTTPTIAPKATGGDIIDYDGTYWIHTFLSSGTFTPTLALSCDYLVVAGGGGGGTDGGGGGGAGGLRSTVTATGGGGSLESKLNLTTTAYSITVGAGGAATTSGSNSVFSTITSTGGGGGGAGVTNGTSGGSGGGAGIRTKTGGTGTANQGYAGGNSTYDGAAGGGGANASGANAPTSTDGGNGGAGVATSITGSSVTYAGGGGGSCRYSSASTRGLGGAGGGGAGGLISSVGTAGTANTGGGGGGGAANNSSLGGAGGSGIVIIRYLAA